MSMTQKTLVNHWSVTWTCECGQQATMSGGGDAEIVRTVCGGCGEVRDIGVFRCALAHISIHRQIGYPVGTYTYLNRT